MVIDVHLEAPIMTGQTKVVSMTLSVHTRVTLEVGIGVTLSTSWSWNRRWRWWWVWKFWVGKKSIPKRH